MTGAIPGVWFHNLFCVVFPNLIPSSRRVYSLHFCFNPGFHILTTYHFPLPQTGWIPSLLSFAAAARHRFHSGVSAFSFQIMPVLNRVLEFVLVCVLHSWVLQTLFFIIQIWVLLLHNIWLCNLSNLLPISYWIVFLDCCQ